MGRQESERLSLGEGVDYPNLAFDVVTGEISSETTTYCTLSPLQGALFGELVKNQGNLVTYERLRLIGWPGESMGERVDEGLFFRDTYLYDLYRTQSVISRVRRRLRSVSSEFGERLECLYNRGYQWTASSGRESEGL